LHKKVFNPINAFRSVKKTLFAMADVNLSFLHGMALESAKLAVNYVRGTGDGGDETAAAVTSDSVHNTSLFNVTAVSL
jgi:homoserine dehydrogenase